LEGLAGPGGSGLGLARGSALGSDLGSDLEGHVWDLLAHWVFGSWDMRLICYRFIIRNLVYNNEGWNNNPTLKSSKTECKWYFLL